MTLSKRLAALETARGSAEIIIARTTPDGRAVTTAGEIFENVGALEAAVTARYGPSATLIIVRRVKKRAEASERRVEASDGPTGPRDGIQQRYGPF